MSIEVQPTEAAEPLSPIKPTVARPIPPRKSGPRGRAVAWIAAALALALAGTLAAGFVVKSEGLNRARSAIQGLQGRVSAAQAAERSLQGKLSDLHGRIAEIQGSVGACQGAVRLDVQYRKAVDDMLNAALANNRAGVEAAAQRAGAMYDRMNAANTVCLDQSGSGGSSA